MRIRIHALTQPRVRSPTVSLSLPPSDIHPFRLISFHSHDPSSRVLSHAQAAPRGEPLSPSPPLGWNNYSISRAVRSLIVLLGCRCRGRTAERGAPWRGGRVVVVLGGGCVLAAAHPVLSGGAQSTTNELRLAS